MPVPIRQQIPLFGLLTATAMSVTPNSVVAIAVPWLVLERTGSAALAGLVIGRYTALASAAGPLGLLAFCPQVDAFGPAVGFQLIGVGCVIAALLAAISGGLRGLGRLAPGPGDPLGAHPTA